MCSMDLRFSCMLLEVVATIISLNVSLHLFVCLCISIFVWTTYPAVIIHPSAPISITPPTAPSNTPAMASGEVEDPDGWSGVVMTSFGLYTSTTETPFWVRVASIAEAFFRRASRESAERASLDRVAKSEMLIFPLSVVVKFTTWTSISAALVKRFLSVNLQGTIDRWPDNSYIFKSRNSMQML